jgi:UDP-N-acetylglucosamine--N-acetylmuramyl-(pentapeptide) pyrophosphoryl-undecaprenol N-acetylglucosamine transferase
MTIVLCGGGSGGHITPLLAVASELRKKNRKLRIIYIGEKNGKFAHIVEDSGHLFDEKHFIYAGKLRRYHGESLKDKLLDWQTMLLNLRDIFKLLIGAWQSFWLLRRLKPNSLLLKGGFVCVPVALTARLLGRPYVTHDSDALPGLSNRIAGRWARYHATGQPAKYYNYPPESVRFVGVPTDERFRDYSASEKRILKEKYHMQSDDQVLLITGGSNGARRLNEAVIDVLPKLLKKHKNLYVFHQIGAGNDDQVAGFPEKLESRVIFFDFSAEIFHMSAIADVVITRAGASAMADYAAQKKTCIVVPNPYLTGGHQLKNAEVLSESGAAIVVSETDMLSDKKGLYQAVNSLLTDEAKRAEVAKNLHRLNPGRRAASDLADLVVQAAGGRP